MNKEGLKTTGVLQKRSLPDVLVWVVPLVGLLLSLSLMPYQVDDAYIAYRYAANIAAERGMTFNPGEAASEGFSSPFWLLLLTLGAKFLPMELLPFLGMALGLFVYFGLLLVFMTVSRIESNGARLFGILILGLWPGLVFYASTGMETLLFILCVLIFHCAVLNLLPRRWGLAAALLSVWIRPEGGWLIVALLLSFLPFAQLRRRLLSKEIVLLVTVLVVSGVMLIVTRWLLFADILPNTFYAKLPDYADGVSYLKGLVLNWHGALLILLAAGGALAGELRHRSFFLAGIAWAAASVLEGGDWMPHHRFLLPAIVLFIFAAFGARRAPRRVVRLGAGGMALVLAVLLGWQDLAIVRRAQSSYDRIVKREMWIARWAVENRVSSLVSVDIGVLGYYSGAKIVDVVGLTDRHIARSAGGHLNKQFDLDYVFVEQKPECLVLRSTILPVIENGQLTRCRPGSKIERRLFLDHRLLTDYRLKFNLNVKNDPRQSKLLFLRRDHPLARKLTAVSRIMF